MSIRNSLPEMSGTATLRRGFIAFCLVGALSAPATAHAENKSPAPKRVTTEMPGGKFRKRNAISLAAHSALSIITRTENIEDPVYVNARRATSDLVAQAMSLDAERLHKAWGGVPRDHQIAVLAAITQLNVRYVPGKEDSYVQMDCSGLMWYSWRVAGVDAPRQAVSLLDPRMRVERKDARAGDVVGEGTHVHLYLGIDLAMIHAPFNGKKVKFKIMSEEQAARVVWTDPSKIATYRL